MSRLNICRRLLIGGYLLLSVVLATDLKADFVIVGYNSTNPNGSNGPPSPNLNAAESQFVTALQLSRGNGVTPNQGITFNSSNWSTASTVNLNSNKYIEWGWSASSQALDLTSMTMQYDRSSTGPKQLAIAVSINGGGFQTIFNDTSVFIGDDTNTIGLSSFRSVNSAIFRLFGFDASATGGTLDIERFTTDPDPSRGIVVRGDLTTVPEPGSFMLLAGLIVLSLVASLKKRDAFAFLRFHAGC